MASIILTLDGVLQSWGITMGTDKRRTGLYPTKSAVIGMIAGAMGRDRGESVDDLRELRMSVRVDHAGSPLTDFHTARKNKEPTAPQRRPTPENDTSLTDRGYLNEAVFVVILEGEPSLIRSVHEAMLRPVYAPFLGRRASVPTRPVYPPNSVVHDKSSDELLREIPWKAPRHVRGRPDGRTKTIDLVVVRDAPHGSGVTDTVNDNPGGEYGFLPRAVVRGYVKGVPVEDLPRPKHVTHIMRSPYIGGEVFGLNTSRPKHDPFALVDPKG